MENVTVTVNTHVKRTQVNPDDLDDDEVKPAPDNSYHPASRHGLPNYPEELHDTILDGFRFTKDPPYVLKVFTGAYEDKLPNEEQGRVGYCVWWGHEGKAERITADDKLPETTHHTVIRGELFAIIPALEDCPVGMPLEISLGDNIPWRILTYARVARQWFDLSDPNRDILGHTIVLLRRREQSVEFRLVKGHYGSKESYVVGPQASEQGQTSKGKPVRPRLATKWLVPDPLINEECTKNRHISATQSLLIESDLAAALVATTFDSISFSPVVVDQALR